MAHLINKDALVAEIERRQKIHFNDYHVNRNGSPADYGACNALTQILAFINTLELKEVDLEHEVESYWKQCDMTWCRDAYSMTHIRSMLSDIAKHFFEFGLSVNNPITASDRGMAEEIIFNLKRVEQDYRINLTREMEWLRNKVKKG